MLSTRYHIASIMAVFLALGVGILIGGTLGQKWMHEAEDSVVKMLMNKYDQQLSVNQELKKQLGSLQLIYRQLDPILQNKKILWIRPDDASNEMIAFIFKAAGADWREINPEPVTAAVSNSSSVPDIILISNVETHELLLNEMQRLQENGDASVPMVLDVSAQFSNLDEPEEVVNFIFHLKQLTEGDNHAATDFNYHTGME